MARYESTIEVSWKAYVAMLDTAESMLRHGLFVNGLFDRTTTHEERVKLSKQSGAGEICAPGYCREAATVFCAFAFEAYLNHLGQEIHPCWNQMERLSWEGKLEVLSERIGYKIDYGRKPFQTLKKLFERRNRHAHGKSIPRKKKTILHDEPLPYSYGFGQIDWGAMTQAEVAGHLEAVRAAIEALNNARPKPDPFPFFQDPTSASTKTNPEPLLRRNREARPTA